MVIKKGCFNLTGNENGAMIPVIVVVLIVVLLVLIIVGKFSENNHLKYLVSSTRRIFRVQKSNKMVAVRETSPYKIDPSIPVLI